MAYRGTSVRQLALPCLQSEFGVSSPIDAYPKLKGVASGIRSLEFYKNVKPVGREGYSAKDETFSAWKK